MTCPDPKRGKQPMCFRCWACVPYDLQRKIWADPHNVDLLSMAALEVEKRKHT